MRPGTKRVNDDEMKRLWPTHITDKEIAARLWHHRSVIRRRASQLGLKPRRLVRARLEPVTTPTA